jgi:ComF family protein
VLRIAGVPVFALGSYEGVLRRAVLALKGGRRDVGTALARSLAERWGARLRYGDVLVAVPTTRRRRLTRGFDQAGFLARAISERTGRPVVPALRRTSEAVQQGLSRTHRLRAERRFAYAGGSYEEPRTVVLLDDVVTTGSTLAECVAALRQGGLDVRGALVLAQTCIAAHERGVMGPS